MPWKRQAARIVRPAEVRSASTSPVRTCSPGRSSTAHPSICSSAPTRRRCRSRPMPARSRWTAASTSCAIAWRWRSQRSAPAIATIQGLIQPSFRRIAVGDPQAVPAGVYAKQYLQAVNLWTLLESRIVPVANVRAALTAVETGSADAAILYRSDLTAAGRARLAFVVSGPGAPRIVYPAAIVRPRSSEPRRSSSWASSADGGSGDLHPLRLRAADPTRPADRRWSSRASRCSRLRRPPERRR